jgi:hypothetical protein
MDYKIPVANAKNAKKYVSMLFAILRSSQDVPRKLKGGPKDSMIPVYSTNTNKPSVFQCVC